jgi:SAM-dependent methyltransferase
VKGAPMQTFLANDGDAYELQMGRWSQRLAPLLIDFAGIDRCARVLDVGCGTGNLAVCLAGNPAIGSVTGLDLAPPTSNMQGVEMAIHVSHSRSGMPVRYRSRMPVSIIRSLCWRCSSRPTLIWRYAR